MENLEKLAEGKEFEIEPVWSPEKGQKWKILGMVPGNAFIVDIQGEKNDTFHLMGLDGKLKSSMPHSKGYLMEYLIQGDNLVSSFSPSNTRFLVECHDCRDGSMRWSFSGAIDEFMYKGQGKVLVTDDMIYVAAKGNFAGFSAGGEKAFEVSVPGEISDVVIHNSGKFLYVEHSLGATSIKREVKVYDALTGGIASASVPRLTDGFYTSDLDLPQMIMRGDYLFTRTTGGRFAPYTFPGLKPMGEVLTGNSLYGMVFGDDILLHDLFIAVDHERISGRSIIMIDLGDLAKRPFYSFGNKGTFKQLIGPDLVLSDPDYVDIFRDAYKTLKTKASTEGYVPSGHFDNPRGISKFLVSSDGAWYPVNNRGLGRIVGVVDTVTEKRKLGEPKPFV